MHSQTIEVNSDSVTVEQGDAFVVQGELNFGDGRTLEEGDVVTVGRISKQMDGVHFDFVADSKPGEYFTIYQFALEENLERNVMSFK